MSETNTQNFEVLLIDEFAKKLKVGRSTIFDWKKKGVLKSGKHYIKRGGILRFFWEKDMILSLDESSDLPGDGKCQPKEKKSNRIVGINLDY